MKFKKSKQTFFEAQMNNTWIQILGRYIESKYFWNILHSTLPWLAVLKSEGYFLKQGLAEDTCVALL